MKFLIAILLCASHAESFRKNSTKSIPPGWTLLTALDTTCSSDTQIAQKVNAALGASATDTGTIQKPSTNANSQPPHVACASNHLQLNLYHNDNDPTTGDTDRSRLEIHAQSSRKDLNAVENQVFAYAWSFQLNGNLKVSDKFFHIFQLKARPQEGDPLFTLQLKTTGIYLRKEVGSGGLTTTKLAELTAVLGRWVAAYVEVFWSTGGSGYISVNLADSTGKSIGSARVSGQTYPGSGQSIYPKWGLYRGLPGTYNTYDTETITALQILRKL